MIPVVFVHIPKTAGGSIRTWLKSHREKYNFSVASNESSHETLKEIIEKNPFYSFSFICTRNTYDRVISLYEWNKQNLDYKIRKYQRRNLDFTPEIEYGKSILQNGIVHYLQSMKSRIDYETQSQLEWINGVDIILDFDNLKKDFLQIQKKLKCYEPLNQKIHALNYDSSVYYNDPAFIKIVEELYGDEIEFFKYRPK